MCRKQISVDQKIFLKIFLLWFQIFYWMLSFYIFYSILASLCEVSLCIPENKDGGLRWTSSWWTKGRQARQGLLVKWKSHRPSSSKLWIYPFNNWLEWYYNKCERTALEVENLLSNNEHESRIQKYFLKLPLHSWTQRRL